MKSLFASVALAAVMAAGVASADIEVVNYTIHGGNWVQTYGSAIPYGVDESADITGSFTLNTTPADRSVFWLQSFTYVTGTKVWTLADVNKTGSVIRLSAARQVDFFIVAFGPGNGNFTPTQNLFASYDAVQISDGTNSIACGQCITDPVSGNPTATPEPATWTMMIVGLGLAGAALRRRRRTALA